MNRYVTLIALFMVGGVAGSLLGLSGTANAELRRRHHAQFCFPETDFIDDYYIWGFDNLDPNRDGRINNQSDLINHRPRRLWCPIISDSQMPHADLKKIVVHGSDFDDTREVTASVCVSRFTSLFVSSCTPTYGTGLVSTGDFELDITDLSAIQDRTYDLYWGYPYVLITLPDGQTETRVSGYEVCADDDAGSC